MSKKLTDYLYKSKFSLSLIQKSGILIAERGKKHFNNEQYLPTENEKRILKVFDYFGSLQKVLEDIENVIRFLNLNEKKVKKVYSQISSTKDYYKYHFENYIIRVISLQDILGKLGNVLYETGIDEEKCNAYNFKEKLKKNKEANHTIIAKILDKSKEVKDLRHRKLHKGEVEIKNLSGVIFCDELSEITNIKFDSILKEISEQKLKIEINKIEIETFELLDLFLEFFDKSLKKLDSL